jgi:AbrB family looped-hinge helix DNA binding protein
MTTAVSEKGQVTIPKRVRDQLGIRPGTTLTFAAVGGKLVASKAAEAGDVFEKWRGRGRIPGGLSVDAYLAKARDGHIR